MDEDGQVAFERAKARILARLNKNIDGRYGTHHTTEEDLELLKGDTEAKATEDRVMIRRWIAGCLIQ